ncbi:hypothetical protein [Pseudoprimorskyibacter insulae]|uniref:5-dehydro-2-deoxygluconokinase n=1 Tax=Pseudoprimorskyibacter insulae TaxID=1695997 RepID=A0A2R8AZK5_9RHOB|nr:hypothetical protein [Pseudoprimorskyibacter insulae]SPF81456.1 5-dehydro-2-deoxygluconokinase [Pseudoprimorskyibacter insulae]
MTDKTLDVVTIGRAGVDLYGAQIGGRLEDMGSFEKYIGGSPTNIACHGHVILETLSKWPFIFDIW